MPRSHVPAPHGATSLQKTNKASAAVQPSILTAQSISTTSAKMPLPLPQVHSPVDCASFSHTVLPFLAQLTSLPETLRNAGKDAAALKEIYLSTNPLVTSVAFCLLLSGLFLVWSEINQNHSQVDRCWSLLPAVYNVHYAVWARLVGIKAESLDTIAVVTVIWGLRLTFNYWRKGGYQIGSEDYRWQYVRSKINNRFLFFLFNIVFISLFQSLLLFTITAPTYNFLLLSQVKDTQAFALPDLIFSRVAFSLIIIEYFADQQQWQFHCAKSEYHKNARIAEPYKNQFTPEDLERGFAINGLWSLSRHPNFAAEQAFWATLYLWNAYRTESYLQWTGLGILGYLLIFQGSTPLTESISAGKYPEYSEYQARVGRFIPRLSVKPKYKGNKKARKQKAAQDASEDQKSK